MQELLEEIQRDFHNEIMTADDLQILETVRPKYFGRKGKINDLFSKMKNIEPDDRPAMGKAINDLRDKLLAWEKDVSQDERLT